MVSNKLRSLFLISIPLFAIHGLEEYFTGFYTFESVYRQFGDSAEASFIIGQVALIALAVIMYRFLLHKKLGFILSVLWGLLLIYEVEHVYRAITLERYTPGLLTSFLFYPLMFFYWRQLISDWKKSK